MQDNSTARIILTVVISTVIIIGWSYFFGSKPEPQQKQKAKVEKKKTPAEKNHNSSTSGPTSQSSQPTSIAASSQPSSQPLMGPISLSKEGTHTTIDWKAGEASVSFTDLQASLRHVVLKNKRYTELRKGKLRQVDLVQTEKNKGPWPLQVEFVESDFKLPKNAQFELVSKKENQLIYQWQSNQVLVEKSFTLDKTRPILWFDLKIKNLSSNAINERLKVKLFAQQDPHAAKPGMTNPYPTIPTGLCQVNGKIERRSVGAIDGTQSGCSAAGCGMGEGPFNMVGNVKWIASDDRYFLIALVPREEGAQRLCDLSLNSENKNVVDASLLFQSVKIKANESHKHQFMVFLGAKDLAKLDTVKSAAKKDLELSDSIEFGWFAILCRPMLALLKFFYSFLGNWGLAIILLTIFVKGLTFYWTHKSMVSMRNMQKLKPKMDALKKKYGDDKARLNQETMNLYRAHKVNPLGGCLPMVIQMPIWFALYRTLGNAQELYHSPFFGWISDLTAPDPYYILPIAMGISMFIQQAITPQPMEGAQAKMMKYFMPGMFTFMMLMLPAGLTLYIFINTLLTMVHQWHMNHSDPLPSKEQSEKEVNELLNDHDHQHKARKKSQAQQKEREPKPGNKKKRRRKKNS